MTFNFIRLSLVLSVVLLTISCMDETDEIPILVEIEPYNTETRGIDSNMHSALNSGSNIFMKSLNINNLPKEIENRKDIEALLHWQEGDQTHIALLKHQANNNSAGALICNIYTSENDEAYKETLTVEEATFGCNNNANINFTKNNFLITDLDNDGHSELWLGYSISCAESGESSKELCLLYNKQLYKYNASKGKFNNHFSAEIVNFAKELLK